MSEQGLPSDAEKLSGGGVSVGVSHFASPGVSSVHRTPGGHRVICEGHFCPSAQCPLCVLCKKDLAPRLLLLLPTHGSFLRIQLTGAVSKLDCFVCSCHSTRKLVAFLETQPLPLSKKTSCLSQSPQRRGGDNAGPGLPSSME